jgi:hypothetical protein
VPLEDEMKKLAIIVLGLGLMLFGCESPSKDGGGGSGGTGGTGGTPEACTEPADCDDDNVCTFDNCLEGECSNLPVAGETDCTVMGGPGLCSEGACTPFCDVKDVCSDGNDCTQDNCDSMLGTCSNPNEPDNTTCMAGTVTGLCVSGVCVGLCDPNPCDDGEECTFDDCNPADGACSYPPGTGQTCDLNETGDGICTDQGVCGDPGLCVPFGKCNDPNECTIDICDTTTGLCTYDPVRKNGEACGGDAGTCQAGACVFEANEFLAVDCELLGNSAALPVDAEVQAFGIAFAGAEVDVVISDVVAIPATLVCGFINPGGFTSAKVANSIIGNSISNAVPTSAQLNSFLGSPRMSPHGDVLFDFGDACGCDNPGAGDLVPPCGTGPGIAAPGFVRTSDPQTIPPPPPPFPITPNAAGTVDFTVDYMGLALEIRELAGNLNIPEVCIGGACPFSGTVMSTCTPIDREGDGCPGALACKPCIDNGNGATTCGGSTSAMAVACTTDADCTGPAPTVNDSPRVMYDATCSKAQFDANLCIPFEEFPSIADACKGEPRLPPPPCCNVPDDLFCADPAAHQNCCAELQARWPTATAAQQPRLPVNPAP